MQLFIGLVSHNNLSVYNMKKIILLLFFISPLVLKAQPAGGDGTSGNPYNGLITTPWTLNGDKYCNDLTVSSGTFTISSGSILRFNTDKTLTINGTGVLSAIGNSSNYITFTASGTSWGHIYFNNRNNTSNSTLSYCVIEKGNSLNLSPAFGGGILININGVVLSNCIIRNNSSGWGGGVFLDKYSNSTISNCQFINNSTVHEGAGLYIWANTNSTITNSLIRNNSASGSGGGLFIGEDALDIQVINSSIINNSVINDGANLALVLNNDPTYKPTFINCIIWGSSNSIVYGQQTPQPTDFVNCAIQNPISGSTTNCISLNPYNKDPSGPNFINPGPSGTIDLSIDFVSPCRDAGTNTGAPVHDIINNYRIGTTDIGAYENQYSRWTGSTSAAWADASNWEQSILPSTSLNAVITDVTNDPSITVGDVTVTNLVTETGGALTVGGSKLLTATQLTNSGSLTFQPAAKGTFITIVNSGTIKLETDVSDVSSLIFTNFSGSDITHELYLTGGEYGIPGSKTYKWHYISTPVTTINTSVFTSKTNNLAQFIESRPTTGLIQGWVAFDGYDYSTGFSDGPTFSELTPGKGYDYYYSSDWEYTFSGQPNSGSTPTSVTLKYSGTDDNLYGYNLVGNPYPSGIDWDYITANGYPANTSQAVYFTSNNTWITYSNGVSIPDGAATNIIPPMQGFFLKTFQNNTTFTIPLAARTHNSIHPRYKGAVKGSETIPLVRLSTTENGVTDETVIRFDDQALSGMDYDFDAVKLFVSSTSTQIYSSMSSINYAINGLPFPVSSVEIPIIVNLLTTGNHTISATQVQGLDKYSIKLKDTYTGLTTDLNTTPVVTFSTAKGTLSDRFVLIISDITTGVEDNPVVQKNPFNIYQAFNYINIQTLADEWDGQIGSLRIIDMTGKIISELRNIEFSKNSVSTLLSPTSCGLYIVEIKSGIKRYVGKIIIK
jgi:hypothetical protein